MFKHTAAALLALAASVPFVSAKDVFAHMIIGNTASYTSSDWQSQVALASEAGISGFALNIAKDSYTTQQLGYAYDAAEQSANFKMFISFDYAAAEAQGGFASSDVVSILKQYGSRKGQYMYQGKPLVSTFEGPDNKGDWPGIKSQVDCFFMPDWSSLGPQAAAAVPGIDGLFSWDAWPEPGQAQVPSTDQSYISALAGKPYMKPISPWFYTDLSSKNWMWRSDNLWHASWAQALALQPQPEFIELLTWNDWGESSYLAPNPANPSAYPAGAAAYNTPTNHSAWLNDLPFYINAYKNGASAPSSPASGKPATSSAAASSPAKTPVAGSSSSSGNAAMGKPHITFSHRLSPLASCASTGTQCGQPGQQQVPAAQCAEDIIAFTVFPGTAAAQPVVTVEMAGTSKQVTPTADGTGAYNGNVTFSEFGGVGAVTVSATGAGVKMGPVTGDPITQACSAGWNAYVGSSV